VKTRTVRNRPFPLECTLSVVLDGLCEITSLIGGVAFLSQVLLMMGGWNTWCKHSLPSRA
jgi:hypothetical protein